LPHGESRQGGLCDAAVTQALFGNESHIRQRCYCHPAAIMLSA